MVLVYRIISLIQIFIKPKFFEEAIKTLNTPKLKAAIDKEIQSFINNEIFEVVN